jgi:WD40 repeat protein
MDVEAGRTNDAETLIFVNYRTSDGGTPAAFLHTELSRRFGATAVFLDYESIPLGRDFGPELLDRVRGCAVLLAVIADRWLEGVVGERLIDDPDDWVRREILEALRHGVPVVPVLFADARSLSADLLPAELAVLSKLQYFEIRSRRQRHDINGLADHLARTIPRLRDLSLQGLRSALVRFRDGSGAPVGAGLLFAPDRVVTCARVVAEMLDVDSRSSEVPSGVVVVEFPLLRDGEAVPVVEGEVVGWQPVGEDGTGDVAVLRLSGEVPAGAVPPPLAGDGELWGHRFQVCGFPASRRDGRWLEGELRARQGTERIELKMSPGQTSVDPGFNGAPVWDETASGVAGLTMTAADQGTAFLLPVSVLGLERTLPLPEPFRGLDAFAIEDAKFFYGRDEEIRRLLEIAGTRSLVVVAGPSGSGKSSLVRAGLLARLRHEGVVVSELQRTPGVGAQATLADLLAGLGAGDRPLRREQIRQRLTRGNEEIALVTVDLAREVGEQGAVLFLDQFEEVVAEDRDVAREMLRLLVRVLAAQPRALWLRAVVTLRSGSLDELLTTELAGSFEHAVTFIGAMNADSLRSVVTEPVRAVGGVVFEDGLVARVLADAGVEPGRLPLVEFTLTELWQRRREDRLTHAAYDEIGGVSGALAQYAEHRLWQELSEPQREQARQLLSRLARPAEDGGFTRHRVHVTELNNDARMVLNVLAATRLVVISDGGKIVELAHQALIDQWPRLRDWLTADREFLAWREELAQRRKQWERAGRDRRSLLRGIALARARDWRAQRGSEMSNVEQAFIVRSHVQARRGMWTWRAAGVLILVIALVVAMLAAQTAQQSDQLDASLRNVNATLLGQEAGRTEDASVTSLQLAQAAWRESPGNPDAFGALWNQYVQWHTVDRTSLPSDISGTFDVSASSDGDVVAIAAVGGKTVVVWRGALRGDIRPVRVSVPSASAIQVSPDGRLLAVQSDVGELSLWRVDQRLRHPVRLRQPNYGEKQPVDPMRFSADSQYLATASSMSGEVQLWDVTSRRSIPTSVRVPPQPEWSEVVPMPGGKAVLTRIGGGPSLAEISLRDVGTGDVLRTFPSGSGVLGNGTAVASCEQDIIRIRNTVSDADLSPTPATRCSPAEAAGNSSPGDSLTERVDLTGQFVRIDADKFFLSRTNETYLHWRSGRRYTVATSLGRSTNYMGAGILTPDGGFALMLPISDALVRLHVPNPARPPAPFTLDPVEEPVLDPEGNTWVMAQGDHLVLIDTTTGKERARATAPTPDADTKPTVEFTPDGARIVAASRQELRIYRATDLELEREVTLPQASDALAQNAQLLASPGITALSNDEVAVLDRDRLSWWQLDTGRPLNDFMRLPADLTLPPENRPNVLLARPGHHGQVVIDTGEKLAIWDLIQRRQIATFPSHTNGDPSQVAMNSTGSQLATRNAENNRIEQWNLDTRRPLPAIHSDTNKVIGFYRDLLVLSLGDSIQLWRADTSTRLGEAKLNLDTLEALYLHNDKLVYVTHHRSEPGTYMMLPVALPIDPHAWFQRLCQINDRDFTPNELTRLPQDASRERPCLGTS